jgi:hypothetical protein
MIKILEFDDLFNNAIRFTVTNGVINDDEKELFRKLNKGEWTLLFLSPPKRGMLDLIVSIAKAKEFQKIINIGHSLIHENPNAILLVATFRLTDEEKRNVMNHFESIASFGKAITNHLQNLPRKEDK